MPWSIRCQVGGFRRPLVLAIVLVGASASAGGLALAGTFGGTAINPQAWVNGQRVQPEQANAPDQSAALGILRRPRVASDALPPEGIQAMTDSPSASSGANVNLSRRAQGITDGAAWVIPGDGQICTYFTADAGGGGTCQPDAAVTNDNWPPITSGNAIKDPGMTVVSGLVPDGVTQVTLTLGGGSTVTVPVHENVYLATVHGGCTSVSYTGPNGPVTLGT